MILPTHSTSGLWDISLQDWLTEISKMDLPLAITVDTYGASTMLERIMNGTMDLAFMYYAPQGLNLISYPLKNIQLKLVSSFRRETVTSAFSNGFINVNWGLNFGVEFATHFSRRECEPVKHRARAYCLQLFEA